MTIEAESALKTRLKYGLYALIIVSGLLVGGVIIEPTWLEAFKVIATSFFA